MAGEQILLPFAADNEDVPDEPVTPEVYVHIVKSRTVREVSEAFRGERIRPASQVVPAIERKRA
jgi:hypothetical protein